MNRTFRIVIATLVPLALCACQTAYFKGMETIGGMHKRDILVKRVEHARDSQEDARIQFTSALEAYRATVNFEGGTLDDLYLSLKTELKRIEARADDVRKRVAAVEQVSEALFVEWEQELNQYTEENLRRSSEEKMNDTRKRYDQLMQAMHRAEDSLEPVLMVFRDQVLYMKHNLNAQAIASLQNELVSVETDVQALLKEMETAINEANAFIRDMGYE